MQLLPPRAEMERAFFTGDASYDGIFWVAVRTTGVFCRPSCPARKPRPENVEFFTAPREAVTAGYRACRRCRPLETDGRPPEWVARLLAWLDAAPENRPTAAALAELGVEPARARRWFREHHGITFAAFARQRRMHQARERLRVGADLDDVIFGHGYESHSGFRTAYGQAFGVPPGRGRQAAAIVTAVIEGPLGPLRLAATDEAVCLLEFSEPERLDRQLEILRRRFGCPVVAGESELLARAREELKTYFAGGRREFSVPLSAPGTPFQEAVWAGLRSIPHGQTISYEELARRVGRPGAQRAVGLANGQNRIAIFIPCHRVVNKGGALGGYGGGLWRKRLLLELERTGRLPGTGANLEPRTLHLEV